MRNLFVKSAVALAAAALSGCSTNPYNVRAVGQSGDTARHVSEKSYQVGREQTAYVGQAVARVKDYDVIGKATPSLISPVAMYASWWMGSDRAYQEGAEFQAAALMDYEGTTYYIATSMPPLYKNIGLLVGMDGQYNGMAIASNGVVFRTCSVGAVCVKPDQITFKKSVHETVLSTSKFVNFEIVYSGTSKDTINLLYREYTPDDMARPAFTQNLTYDRGSPSIRFREMLIRVVDASNESLRYVVEADGLSQ